MNKEVKVVRTEDVPAVTPLQCTVEGFRVRRVITKKRLGSERLMLGMSYIDPNCKGYKWTFKENDEVYYIIRGKITLHYDGKKVDAGEGDALLLPSGLHYQLDNAGTEPVILVYVLNPPPE
jgi:mannose-6-phosphate isomerase-like protein (cupin superfamily)